MLVPSAQLFWRPFPGSDGSHGTPIDFRWMRSPGPPLSESQFGWFKREASRGLATFAGAAGIAGNRWLAGRPPNMPIGCEVLPPASTPTQPIRRHADREVGKIRWIGSAPPPISVERYCRRSPPSTGRPGCPTGADLRGVCRERLAVAGSRPWSLERRPASPLLILGSCRCLRPIGLAKCAATKILQYFAPGTAVA